MTDGAVTLWDQIDASEDGKKTTHTSQIAKGTEEFSRQVEFPLGLGKPNPPRAYDLGQDLDRAARGSDQMKLIAVEDGAKLDGVDVVHLTFDSTLMRIEYWVDLACGAVPRRQWRAVKDDPAGSGTRVDYDDVRHVADKGWVPFVTTTTQVGDRLVRRLAIEEADFAHHPSPSEFRLEFPEPRPMQDTATMMSYDPRKIWDLADLSSPPSQGAKPMVIAQPGAPAPVMPGVLPARPWWTLPAIVLGGLLLAASAWVGVRRWRHA